MPFAPYVLAEDAERVFEITSRNRYAARFMTICCEVRPQWRERLTAITHLDNTHDRKFLATRTIGSANALYSMADADEINRAKSRRIKARSPDLMARPATSNATAI